MKVRINQAYTDDKIDWIHVIKEIPKTCRSLGESLVKNPAPESLSVAKEICDVARLSKKKKQRSKRQEKQDYIFCVSSINSVNQRIKNEY